MAISCFEIQLNIIRYSVESSTESGTADLVSKLTREDIITFLLINQHLDSPDTKRAIQQKLNGLGAYYRCGGSQLDSKTRRPVTWQYLLQSKLPTVQVQEGVFAFFTSLDST